MANSDLIQEQRNSIYDLVRGSFVDGLILWNGHLTHFINDEQKKIFVNRYQIPVVTVEGPLEGYPLIDYGNAEGIKMLMAIKRSTSVL